MATQDGPEYPGIEDGLIFCFDPKNRDCWSGGFSKLTNIAMTTHSGSTDNFDTDETVGALATEGYFDYDGTDDTLYFGKDLNSYLTLDKPFSFCAWFNTDETGTNQSILANSEDNGISGGTERYRGTQMRITTSNKIRIILTQNASFWYYKDSTAISTSTWYFAVATYDGSDSLAGVNLYMNGALDNDSSGQNAPSSITSNDLLRIGNVDGDTQDFNGKIGPCMIYNRELTAAEVLTNYNRLKGRFGL